MAVYKRGGTYWYEFRYHGERIQQSAETGNKELARQIETVHRARLLKGAAGIGERPLAPRLKEFAPRFENEIETVCAGKPATVGFYKEKLRRLLEDPELAELRLDAIDEAQIDAYRQRRTRAESRYGRPRTPASVNCELATLRRLLRMAQGWKLVDRVPRIRLLRGERNREFVLAHELEPVYLDACPQPLREVAILIIETGVRPGEGAPRPFLGTSLYGQHDQVRDRLKLDREFVVHSLRHTMLTRLGEAGADAFTIMKIAGFSSVTVSQRFVHPTPEGLERAFDRLEELDQTKREEANAVRAFGERKPAGSLQESLHRKASGSRKRL